MQEAFTISVANLVRDDVLRPDARGEFRWRHDRFGLVKVAFDVKADGADLRMRMRYVLGTKSHTPTIVVQHGGNEREWWIVCPRSGCERRVAKLYMPVGCEEFGCQACHGIVHGWVAKEDEWGFDARV